MEASVINVTVYRAAATFAGTTGLWSKADSLTHLAAFALKALSAAKIGG